MTISDSFKSVIIEPILEEECLPPETTETTWGYDLTKVNYVYLLKAEENNLHPKWTVDMGGDPLMLDADNEELTLARDYMVTDTRAIVFYCKPKFPLQFCYRIRSIFDTLNLKNLQNLQNGINQGAFPYQLGYPHGATWIGTVPTIASSPFNINNGTYNTLGSSTIGYPVTSTYWYNSQANYSNIACSITPAAT